MKTFFVFVCSLVVGFYVGATSVVFCPALSKFVHHHHGKACVCKEKCVCCDACPGKCCGKECTAGACCPKK